LKGKDYQYYPGTLRGIESDRVYPVKLEKKENENYGEVLFVADLHIGHKDFYEPELRRFLAYVKSNPHVQVVMVGDYFEMQEFSPILPDADLNLEQQVVKFTELFYPIRDQIRLALSGNHDARIQKAILNKMNILEILFHKNLSDKIIVEEPNRGAFIVFEVDDQAIPVYVVHGASGSIIQTETQLRRAALSMHVPLIVQGHLHQRGHISKQYNVIAKVGNEYKRAIMSQILLHAGSYLKYPSYAEARSYPITDIGSPLVRFHSEGYVTVVNLRDELGDKFTMGGQTYKTKPVTPIETFKYRRDYNIPREELIKMRDEEVN